MGIRRTGLSERASSIVSDRVRLWRVREIASSMSGVFRERPVGYRPQERCGMRHQSLMMGRRVLEVIRLTGRKRRPPKTPRRGYPNAVQSDPSPLRPPKSNSLLRSSKNYGRTNHPPEMGPKPTHPPLTYRQSPRVHYSQALLRPTSDFSPAELVNPNQSMEPRPKLGAAPQHATKSQAKLIQITRQRVDSY